MNLWDHHRLISNTDIALKTLYFYIWFVEAYIFPTKKLATSTTKYISNCMHSRHHKSVFFWSSCHIYPVQQCQKTQLQFFQFPNIIISHGIFSLLSFIFHSRDGEAFDQAANTRCLEDCVWMYDNLCIRFYQRTSSHVSHTFILINQWMYSLYTDKLSFLAMMSSITYTQLLSTNHIFYSK